MSTRKNNQVVIDTNIIIRFLTNDSPQQSEAASTLFKKSKVNSILIPDLIIAEIIYVLLSVYKLDKTEIIPKIRSLLSSEIFDTNERLMNKTLNIYENNNISFVDSYLIALKEQNKVDKIYSFDKKIQKISDSVISP